MKNFQKFYITFSAFLIIFFLIGKFHLNTGIFMEINLKVILLFIFAIYLWTAQILPNSYISILLILLIGVLKLDSFAKVVSYTFGNTIFIFLLSIIIISYSFKKSGLADRIGQSLLKRFGNSKRKVLFSLMFTSYFLGAFLTAIAGVSISLPIALRIIEINNLKKGDKFAASCILGITYGGLIGGVATPLGTPVNLLMMQYLKELGKFDLTFLHWVAIGFPLSFLILISGFLILVWFLKIDNLAVGKTEVVNYPLSIREKKSIVAFTIIIVLFLFSQFFETYVHSVELNMTIISVICSLMVVLPPFEIIEWKDTLKNLDWESLIFLIGSIALGYLLYNTGTAELIAKSIFDVTGNVNPYLYVFIFCAFTIIMHLMLSSNTVTGTVIIPILISFAQQMGVSPWYVAAPAIFCASLAFILPTESPTNAITFNTGYFELKDMVRIGTLLTIISIVVVSTFLIVYGRITGLYIIG